MATLGEKKKYGYSDFKWICSHQDSWIFSQKRLSSTTLAQDLPHLSTLHPLHRNLVTSTVTGICSLQTLAWLLPSATHLPSTGVWPPSMTPCSAASLPCTKRQGPDFRTLIRTSTRWGLVFLQFKKATILSDNTYQASRKKLKQSPLFPSYKTMQMREGMSDLFQLGFLELTKFLFWQR